MNKPKLNIDEQKIQLKHFIMNKNNTWKEYFHTTKQTHLVTLKPCPSCGVHHTPQPVSDRIAEKYSLAQFECDGCEAYREHLK